MGNLFKLLAYLPDIPSFLALVADISAITKGATEANISQLITDAKPIVAKYAPGVPQSELDAIATDLIALSTLGYDHSLHNDATVAATIVQSLPQILPGYKPTAEHNAALIQALSDWLGDWGLK